MCRKWPTLSRFKSASSKGATARRRSSCRAIDGGAYAVGGALHATPRGAATSNLAGRTTPRQAVSNDSRTRLSSPPVRVCRSEKDRAGKDTDSASKITVIIFQVRDSCWISLYVVDE